MKGAYLCTRSYNVSTKPIRIQLWNCDIMRSRLNRIIDISVTNKVLPSKLIALPLICKFKKMAKYYCNTRSRSYALIETTLGATNDIFVSNMRIRFFYN